MVFYDHSCARDKCNRLDTHARRVLHRTRRGVKPNCRRVRGGCPKSRLPDANRESHCRQKYRLLDIGRSYSSDDIDRTGSPTAGEAPTADGSFDYSPSLGTWVLMAVPKRRPPLHRDRRSERRR